MSAKRCRWWVVIGLALWAGCAQTERAEVAEWADVAEQFAHPQEVTYIAAELRARNGTDMPPGVTWFNLCHSKECGGHAMQYTSLFRETALLAEAIRQLERLAATAIDELDDDERYLLQQGDRWLAEVETRIDELNASLRRLDPAALRPRERRLVEKGLALAVAQLRFATARAPEVRGRLADIFRLPPNPVAAPELQGEPGWPLLDRRDVAAGSE